MRRLGVGYRNELAGWIHSRPDEIDCLEVTAEHFFDHPERLVELKKMYPLFLHGLGLSLGTPGKLDSSHLQRFVDVCNIADPEWVSEHIAFTRSHAVDLGHLNPVPLTRSTLHCMIDHVLELKQACNKPVLLENIATHIQIKSEIAETDFINRLCEATGSGLLLDITNLYVNSKNHHYLATDWLSEIQSEYVRQLHIVGYTKKQDIYHDTHSAAIQTPILSLLETVLEFPGIESIIIERDQDFPPINELEAELRMIGAMCNVH